MTDIRSPDSVLKAFASISTKDFYNRSEKDYDSISAEITMAKRLAFAQRKRMEFVMAEKQRKQIEKKGSPKVNSPTFRNNKVLKKTPGKSSTKKVIQKPSQSDSTPIAKRRINTDALEDSDDELENVRRYINSITNELADDDDSNNLEKENIRTEIQKDKSPENDKSNSEVSKTYFPIFSSQRNNDVQNNALKVIKNSPRPKKFNPVPDDQYQLDAGQKNFGVRKCNQCDFVYSSNEPEDELLHHEIHNSITVLKFNGWKSERVAINVPEWGVNGRIIIVQQNDGAVKLEKVKKILEIVDKELGITTTDLDPHAMIYLAIAMNKVAGICVAQPLEQANRYIRENGVDCFSPEFYPVQCGISRIWVPANKRRNGIGRKLIQAVRSSFYLGHPLSFDDIAFSSPTIAGLAFARKCSFRSDFLIF